MQSPKLELFYFDACPYCQIVLQAVEQLSIKVELLDIFSSEEYLSRLISDTGRRTVPCLYIDNKPMHESADIVRWLKTNKDSLTKRD